MALKAKLTAIPIEFKDEDGIDEGIEENETESPECNECAIYQHVYENEFVMCAKHSMQIIYNIGL